MKYNKEQWAAAKKAGVKTIFDFIKFLKQGEKKKKNPKERNI